MSNSSKKVLLSGVKPTGRPHIGNYFGAMKQMVDLQNAHPEAEKFFMIADYHGLNFIQDAKVMHQNIIDLALDYLAIGLDPRQSVIFKQSDVSAHTELAWIFDTITTMPYLMRAHAFKDAEAKDKEISVGTFNYPMLMAADILLYDATHVPVGQDQKQHIEYARDTAEKFNRVFGETLTLPEPMILKDVAIVPGTDGQKMSKSYGNTIPLFATDEEIRKAVMSIVTDSKKAEDTVIHNQVFSGDFTQGEKVISLYAPVNVYSIHKLFRTEDELATLYTEKAGKYKDLKEALVTDISAFIKPLRERREALAEDLTHVLAVLKDGGSRARVKADAKMDAVRKAIGVAL
ncbi:MAG: tryptophan--tRNA ligase [Patescibacteria group bacterium]